MSMYPAGLELVLVFFCALSLFMRAATALASLRISAGSSEPSNLLENAKIPYSHMLTQMSYYKDIAFVQCIQCRLSFWGKKLNQKHA